MMLNSDKLKDRNKDSKHRSTAKHEEDTITSLRVPLRCLLAKQCTQQQMKQQITNMHGITQNDQHKETITATVNISPKIVNMNPNRLKLATTIQQMKYGVNYFGEIKILQ